MIYCTLEEAWGCKKNIRENFEQDFNYDNNSYDICQQFILHYNQCKNCRDKINSMILVNYNISDKLSNIIDTNKDFIIFILLGVAILLLFNLIKNILNNN